MTNLRINALMIGLALAAPALSQDQSAASQNENTESSTASQSQQAQSSSNATTQSGSGGNSEAGNPYQFPDDSFITLNGIVESVSPNSFVLSYGEGEILVEMDDGDRDADAYSLLEGDKVAVSGLIDDDVFEMKKIEASSVYVDKIDTWFYASAVDEEDFDFISVTAIADSEEPILNLQGRVAEVSGDEFVLETGQRDVTVEVDQLPENPLDDEGYLKLQAGDVVSVRGEIDNDFLEGRELVADSLIKIHDNRI